VKMEAATEWKTKEAISINPIQLPAFPGYEMISLQVFPETAEVESIRNFRVDTSPPARRRAWLQCFLI